jgi:hypothetical protein
MRPFYYDFYEYFDYFLSIITNYYTRPILHFTFFISCPNYN